MGSSSGSCSIGSSPMMSNEVGVEHLWPGKNFSGQLKHSSCSRFACILALVKCLAPRGIRRIGRGGFWLGVVE